MLSDLAGGEGPTGRPRLVRPHWPLVVQDDRGEPVSGAVFMVSYADREEKGSDVNVAAHLLPDPAGRYRRPKGW